MIYKAMRGDGLSLNRHDFVEQTIAGETFVTLSLLPNLKLGAVLLLL